MHVVTTRRQGREREYVTHLLRRSFREGGRVKKETVANLSHLPEPVIEVVRRALAGEELVGAGEAFTIERSVPAGHVEALISMARHLGLARLIDRDPSPERDRVIAMVCQRVLRPGSKLETSRALSQSTLASELSLVGVDEDDLYRALDWLGERQDRIERRLARRHLRAGELVLYDVSSSYFEGHSCPLARRGYSRDERRHSPQIVYGLLCDRDGRPIAVEVFAGSLHDHQTFASQLRRLKESFSLGRVVVCADRGMVTKANIEAPGEGEQTGFITALKAPQVKRLVARGSLQLSLFDEQNLAEVSSEDYPAERLIVCRNPLVAAERERKRSELLAATEADLAEIAGRVERGTLAGRVEIGLAVGAVWNRFKVKKHFELEISDTDLSFSRKAEQIADEAALDGIYVLRTSVPAGELEASEVVRSYKQLQGVERAFRTLKGPDLALRPIHHRLEQRVRAHVFVCMLAYYLEWHLREAWRELLFADEERLERPDPVAKADRSPSAKAKARSKRTATGGAAHSFRSLIAELGLVTRNTIRLRGSEATFEKLSEPSALQARALELARGSHQPDS